MLFRSDDYVSFTQITAASSKVARCQKTGNVVAAANDGGLAAGNVANGPLGSEWRVKYVIGGTNPSFTFSVVAILIP